MKKIILALTLSSLVATPVLAASIEDTIKARQSYYKLIGFNFGQLVAMVKGEQDYDATTAQQAADNLKTISTLHVASLFPAESDNVAQKGKTRALPLIWEDFEGVQKVAGDWKAAVDTLASVASNGKGELAPAVGALGQSCKACHDKYRAKNF